MFEAEVVSLKSCTSENHPPIFPTEAHCSRKEKWLTKGLHSI